jgi:RNA polymerase sigma-70 factor (ECF subfamily)
LQWLEKARRQSAHLRLVPPGPTPRPADELLVADERARRARAALEQLRPSERDALLLRYAGELSFEEVAELCGIDEPAARKRVSRALLRLRAIAAEGTDP